MDHGLDLELEKQKYRLWYEYLKCTPYYHLLDEDLNNIDGGGRVPPDPLLQTEEYRAFEKGYAWWWGSWKYDPRRFTFETFWKENFQTIITKRPEKILLSHSSARYRWPIQGKTLTRARLNVLGRRLWFFRLHEIEGCASGIKHKKKPGQVSDSDKDTTQIENILAGRFWNRQSLPTEWLADSGPLGGEVFRNWTAHRNGDGHPKGYFDLRPQDEIAFCNLISKDIQRAKKIVTAVQEGYFPGWPSICDLCADNGYVGNPYIANGRLRCDFCSY